MKTWEKKIPTRQGGGISSASRSLQGRTCRRARPGCTRSSAPGCIPGPGPGATLGDDRPSAAGPRGCASHARGRAAYS